jgi:hypothetical protein
MSTAAHTQADHIIAKCGGINALARILGHANASTVQGWKERGFVPAHRQSEVLEKAVAAGVPMTRRDFVVHLPDVGESPDPESPDDDTPQLPPTHSAQPVEVAA